MHTKSNWQFCPMINIGMFPNKTKQNKEPKKQTFVDEMKFHTANLYIHCTMFSHLYTFNEQINRNQVAIKNDRCTLYTVYMLQCHIDSLDTVFNNSMWNVNIMAMAERIWVNSLAHGAVLPYKENRTIIT